MVVNKGPIGARLDSRAAVFPRIGVLAIGALTVTVAAFTLFASSAFASKQPVDYIGGSGTGPFAGEFQTAPPGVAVNDTGAGGVPAGTVYASDGGGFDSESERGNRIQRFQREDNGTPGDTSDDTYKFISTWGAGVEKGGTNYEVCTVAAKCGNGAGIGGNGTLAGDGSLSKPGEIAVDQETGEVYVADASSRRTSDDNFRINVYSATGEFLRSFGYDVVESGPDDNGTGYEVCKAGVDVCKAGLPGAGPGQVGARQNGELAAESIAVGPPDGNPAAGTVFLADRFNQRVSTYNLDGSSPGSFGSSAVFATGNPDAVAVDSRGIVYATNGTPVFGASEIVRYDTTNADGEGVGFLAPLTDPSNEIQQVKVTASAGEYRLSFEGESIVDLPYNASASEIQSALAALPAIGPGNIQVNLGIDGAFTFTGALAHTNVPQLVASNGTTPLSGGSVEVTTLHQGTNGPLTSEGALAVEPDPDGAGPKTDVLYGAGSGTVQQFGPANPPGLATPPSAADELHGSSSGIVGSVSAIAIEPSMGRIYEAANKRQGSSNISGGGPGVYVLDNTSPVLPTASLDSISNIAAHSAEANATIDPNGPPATSYHLEYSTDGTHWQSTPEMALGSQETPQAVAITLDPPAGGLQANTLYHVRLVAVRNLTEPLVTSELTFTTSGAAPLAETTGSPIRTSTTALLDARMDPQNTASSFHFEYGSEGPCDSSLCAATAPQAAGSAGVYELVSQQVEGLEPDTTYHYRVVADNGVSGSPVYGEDMTVTTRASDEPLSHGHFPGPPGSDRAYEQVSLPDPSGNPVDSVIAVSDNGNRVLYRIHGGNPVSGYGSNFNQLFAERTASGWHSFNIFPSREDSVGSGWYFSYANNDLSSLASVNNSSGIGLSALYRLSPDALATKVFQIPSEIQILEPVVSDDMSRIISNVNLGERSALFDITSGTPEEIDQLPDGSLPACSATARNARVQHWLSPDGRLAFFVTSAPACGSSPDQLYLRDLQAGETKRISPPPVSGPSCSASLIRTTSGAVFFWSRARLVSADTAQANCAGENNAGGDIYRYELANESVECLTCTAPGVEAEVQTYGDTRTSIAVAEDGSRVYFNTPHALVPGGGPGIYRIDVPTDELVYVGPGGPVGMNTTHNEAISPDGSVLVFASNASGLNAFGGQQNGGTQQYYRYNDEDRSLVCISCLQDGSAPAAPVGEALTQDRYLTGPNVTPMSADGSVIAFATPTPLVDPDQNTPRTGRNPNTGTDVYEWRDGELFLVSDGLTDWPANTNRENIVETPEVGSVSPSGHDIYFLVSAQYTPDALDGYRRVYDARISGGFEYPPPPKPCPLEVCQGTPKGTPEEQAPGTSTFGGGESAAQHRASRKKTAHKKQRKAKKKVHGHQANHKRRAAR